MISRFVGRPGVFGLLCFSAYLLLTFGLYGSTLAAWWCCDDPQILKHAIRYAPWEYFAVPEAWRALIPYSLTPWLSLAYDLDHALFGLNPAGYYAHNLVVIALCAGMICLIAHQWVSGWYAFGGGLLFLSGAPVLVAAHQLMVRHYVEGLLFYLLAFWLVLKAFRETGRCWSWLAGSAFAVAAAAKEIYLPLGLVLFLIPLGSFRQRLKRGWPVLLVMFLYVPWRWYMLGNPVGGYTPASSLGLSDLASAAVQFVKIPALLMSWPWLALAGLLLCAGLLAKRVLYRWLLLLPSSLLLLLLVPLIPLARQPGIGAGSERYLIALWAALTLGTALLAGSVAAGGRIRSQLVGVAVMVLLGGSAWHHTGLARAAMLPCLQEQAVQGKALMTAGERDIIYLTPGVAPWYLSGIIDLQQELGRRIPPPRMVSDEIDLYGRPLAGKRILRYDPAMHRMTDSTLQIRQLLETWQKKIQPRPLSIMMEFDPVAKTLHWQFGPYDQGQYTLLPRVGRQPLPPQGTLRMDKPPGDTFRFRYDSPEGWIAYTPLLRFVMTPQGKSRLMLQGRGLTLAGMAGATQ